jgi:hypothetical protein
MKKVEIALDDASVDILKGVDDIHRNSIVNIGLALVSKTGYYKTLTGKSEAEDLEDIASLDIEDEEGETKIKSSKKKEVVKPAAKATSSWDAF